MKKRKSKKRPVQDIFCNPDVCPNCEYIGEGDSVCMVTQEIVLEDWKPTDNFMGKGCSYAKGVSQ